MLNVSNATKTAYLNGTAKSVIITFPDRNITITNDDIVADSIELTESIENEMAVSFKGCIATKFKFKAAGISTDLRGEYVTATIQAGTTEIIPFFKGYVDSQDNMTFEDIHTEFTCYDVLNKLNDKNMQSWVDSRTYPITVRNFRNQLFSNLGITQESKTLINDNLQISENLKSFMDAPTAVDLLRWICQLNAVFGQIGRDGQFKYRELKEISEGLYPSETTYPSPTTYPSAENAGLTIYTENYEGLNYEPYETEKITKVVIIDAGGLDQGQAGVDGNVFIIQDNPIAFNVNNMRSAARAILAKISDITHIPVIKMECIGFPYMECGDTYVTYTERNVCRTYIFNRTMIGIQNLRDEYGSDTNRRFGGYKTTTQTQINAERKTVLEIQADIVVMNNVIATKATIDDLDATNAVVSSLSAKEAEFETATAKNFDATNARVESLEADHVSVKDLEATNARVESLEADHVTTDELDAVSGRVESLEADHVTTNEFDAVKGRVDSLEADHVTVNQLETVDGKINNLSSIAITTDNLSAQTIDGDQINAGTINADRIVANSISAGQISDGAIGNNQLSNGAVTAGKISNSTITNGKLADSTIKSGKLDVDDIAANAFTSKRIKTGSIQVGSVISGYAFVLTGATISITSGGQTVNVPIATRVT